MNVVRPRIAAGSLERARAAYRECCWAAAFQAFTDADQSVALEAGDLEQLALAAYFVGHDEQYLKTLERAYNAYLRNDEPFRAIRCAFWLGFRLLMRGEGGHATGWFARGQRLIDRDRNDCAERGYLLLPLVEQLIGQEKYEAGYASAAEAAAIGERCGDGDLVACARHQQGRIRLQQGQISAGLALLDETMLTVVAGELSPLVTGLMYCSVIQACQQVYAFDRAFEWTAALTQWCDSQPDMVAFAGVCQVHRAEIKQLRGAWPEAIAEAQRATERANSVSRVAAAGAHYQKAEVLRLTGDFAGAEEAYRAAGRLGLEPQPGLALLRLAQGRTDAAVSAIRRVVETTTEPLKRMRLLPACVEILLAAGDLEAARNACSDLERSVARFDTGVAAVVAAQARGAVDLAEGKSQAALNALQPALQVWQRIDAPHAAARTRVLIGLACRALGDEDGADMELAAARATFERLDARPDLAQMDLLMKAAPPADGHGLSAREMQVLRLVTTGETNKAIARKLGLSERTIDRHVSNIFTKLDVTSRTAATAFAYRHGLI